MYCDELSEKTYDDREEQFYFNTETITKNQILKKWQFISYLLLLLYMKILIILQRIIMSRVHFACAVCLVH